MKKNNGFTLVELLAAISILAILTIITLPSITGMFNSAKKKTFMNEVRQIYKVALRQWVYDSKFKVGNIEYAKCETCDIDSLDLTGRKELEYDINFNEEGCITYYAADDGTYRFEYSGECLLVTDITDEYVVDSTNQTVTNEEYYYAHYNSSTIKVGQSIPSDGVYNSPEELVSSANRNAFVRAKVRNNIVESIDSGILYKGNYYYFKHLPLATYTYNKSIMDSLFPSSMCTETAESYSCDDNDNIASVTAYKDSSKVYVMSKYSYCYLYNMNIVCSYD